MPTELNFRANIFGMKMLGVEYILSASAVGSLQERYVPQHLVIPDQFFDRTKGRVSTFFGNGLVAHVGFAHPVCGALGDVAYDACSAVGATVHKGGTYVCMEGPQFSTLAESKLYRSWGMDIIGMTNLQEAKLAREAEICYATIALVTDYDCWHPDHDSVTVDMIIQNLVANAKTAQEVIADAVARLPVRAHLRVRQRAPARHHHPARRGPRSRQAGPGADHRKVHEIDVDRRHRLDRLRLPDVVSREVHRALPAGAHEPRQPQLPRRHDGQAARRLRARTSPTRWRCSASGRA